MSDVTRWVVSAGGWLLRDGRSPINAATDARLVVLATDHDAALEATWNDAIGAALLALDAAPQHWLGGEQIGQDLMVKYWEVKRLTQALRHTVDLIKDGPAPSSLNAQCPPGSILAKPDSVAFVVYVDTDEVARYINGDSVVPDGLGGLFANGYVVIREGWGE